MLKALFYRLIFLTLLGMLAAPFILKKEDGTALMSLDEFLDFNPDLIKYRYQQALNSMRGFLADDRGIEPLDTESTIKKITTIYKWQDEKGEWHFSNEKSEGVVQEEIEIITDSNVVKFEDAYTEAQSSSTSSAQENIENKPNTENKQGTVKGYLNNMKSTVDDARKVQSQIDADFQRKAEAIDKDL